MDELREVLEDGRFRVAIFGSARSKERSPEYHLVFSLARLIASAEMDLVTGCGPGLMEAASNGFWEGKKDGSISSIRLSTKLPTEQRCAAHLDIKRQFERLSERLDSFVTLSNAFEVTPGGIGTILELYQNNNLPTPKTRKNVGQSVPTAKTLARFPEAQFSLQLNGQNVI